MTIKLIPDWATHFCINTASDDDGIKIDFYSCQHSDRVKPIAELPGLLADAIMPENTPSTIHNEIQQEIRDLESTKR